MFWSDKLYELGSQYFTEADDNSDFNAPANNINQDDDGDDENYSLDGAENMDDDEQGDNPGEPPQGDGNEAPPADGDGDDENYSLDGAENMDDDEQGNNPGEQPQDNNSGAPLLGDNGEKPQQYQGNQNSDGNEAPPDQGGPQPDGQAQGDGNEDDDGDDENYSLDGAENMDDEEPRGNDGNEEQPQQDQDNQGGTSNMQSDIPDPKQRLRDLENSIFNQLTEEQKTQKINELKDLYRSTYFNCQKLLDSIDKVEKTPDNVKVYDYISKSLTDLSTYIQDYLQDVFDSRTYNENANEFEKYIAVLDAVKKVFIELKKREDKISAGK